MVSLKEFHEENEKAIQKKSSTKNNLMKRFKLRTDSSMIIKTEGS